MYRTAAIAILLSGIRAGATNDKCFCPVEDNGASGACLGSPYKKTFTGVDQRFPSRVYPKERCQEFCALEPGRCKGFSFLADIDSSGDNCYLYDSVPEVDAGTSGSCFGLTGTDGGFVELPRKQTGGCGGVCGAPVYAGKRRCDFDDGTSLVSPECNPPGSYIKAKNLQECKNWCQSRGNLCQGFDFDKGKADVCARGSTCFLSCYERRYKPNLSRGLTSSSQDDWTDEFCHARVCDCGGPPPVARNPGFPKQTCNRTPFPTPPPTPSPTTTVDPCADDEDWVYVKTNGKTKGCEWVGKLPNRRCTGKFGLGGDGKVAEGKDACPSKCDQNCQLSQ